MADITISLDNGDNARVFDKSQLLQVDGYDAAVELLKKSLDDAQKFFNNGVEDHRAHDAIFIDGPRGSGKTAFLLNLEKYFEKDSQYKDKIHFCSPIDPTLLENKDRFINIVIGKLHAEVKKKLEKTPSQQQYFAALEAVGAALASFDEADDVTGVDRILAHKSSVGLHHELVRYYRQVCRTLECDAVVLLVDDVDMALKHAYDILDVVRRHLACPLIIPVVTGDLTMYQYIVGKNFKDDLKIKDNDFDTGDLTEQYLKKVLPTHRRIRLLSAQDLIDQYNITISYKDKKLPFQRFYNFIKHLIYLRTNGEENSHPSFMPDSTRGLIQFLLRTAPIIEIAGTLVYDEQSRNKREIENKVRSLAIDASKDVEKFKEILGILNDYWKNIENWPAYYRGRADLLIALSQKDNFPQRPLCETIWFNPLRHPQKFASYQWETEIRKINDNFKLDDIDFNFTLVAMPSLEPYSVHAIFNKSLVSKSKEGMHKLYIRLFSHSEYYSSYQTTNLIFFGRAWELLITSLLIDITEEYLTYIITNPPFFSIFQALPTKSPNFRKDEDPITNEITEDEEEEEYLPRDAISELAGIINEWRKKENPIKPSAQLIYNATNKAFNAFNNIKSELNISDDTALLILERFMRISVNSFASFEKNTLKNTQSSDNVVVHTSVGEGKNLGDFNKDSSYKINIKPTISEAGSATKYIASHPIFRLVGLCLDRNINLDNDFNDSLYNDSLHSALANSKVTSISRRSNQSARQKSMMENISEGNNPGSDRLEGEVSERSLDSAIRNIVDIDQRTLKRYIDNDSISDNQISKIRRAIEQIKNNQKISENKKILQKDGSSFFASLYAAASKHNLSYTIDEWLNS